MTVRTLGILGWLLGGLICQRIATGQEPVVNSIGMKLVFIQPGEFVMGCGEKSPSTRDEWNLREWDEAPAHKVKITRPFLMGATEVTNAQFELFDPSHKQLRGRYGVSPDDNHPVVLVTWKQAVDFCDWLSKKESKPYRLPTEAEWEFACRAGTTTPYNTGETLNSDQANFGPSATFKKNAPMHVGNFKPNAWGIFDMHGNVAEWCGNWFGPYDPGEQIDPVGRVDGSARVTRGGSYMRASHKLGPVRYCRSSNRSGYLPEDANRGTGFRVVQGDLPTTKPLPVPDVPIHQKNVRQGPPNVAAIDPKTPYFADVSKGLVIEKGTWGPIHEAWNHFGAITACPNGDLLAAWYTTVSEEGPECAQAASRWRADTQAWDPPAFFFGTPDCNTHAPVVLSDGKRLYHFCTQSLSGWDDAAECLRTSDDNGATWSRPRIIVSREHPMRMSQPCTAFVAKNGKIVVAVDGDGGHRDERIMISPDRGETWTIGKGDMRKAVGGKYAIHPAVLQRNDGAFMAFLRGPDPMPAVVSKDEGETWVEDSTPFPGISVGQKPAAMRLASGALLLCSADGKRKLLDGKPGQGSSTYAALSLDDGKTWPHIRRVEGPRGYLSVTQAPNGVIYLLGPGTSNARVYCAAFNEAWIKEKNTTQPTP